MSGRNYIFKLMTGTVRGCKGVSIGIQLPEFGSVQYCSLVPSGLVGSSTIRLVKVNIIPKFFNLLKVI